MRLFISRWVDSDPQFILFLLWRFLSLGWLLRLRWFLFLGWFLLRSSSFFLKLALLDSLFKCEDILNKCILQ